MPLLDKWEEQAVKAYGQIEELEYKLEPLRYEVEFARRLLDKAQDEATRQQQTWQPQVDVHRMSVNMAEGDQGISLRDEFFNPDDSTVF